MSKIHKELDTLVSEGSQALGLGLSEEELRLLLQYIALLQKWNTHINLTGSRDEQIVVVQHVLDSLALLPHIPADASRAIDVGSGAGFPGAVVAMIRRTLAITALEPVHKKHAFLATVRRELRLDNLQPLAQRVEAHQSAPTFRPYDVAMSRATFALPVWLERAVPLVHERGIILGMEGAELHELPANATRHPYTLPAVAAARTRAVIVRAMGAST